jgi:hypothetical protein
MAVNSKGGVVIILTNVRLRDFPSHTSNRLWLEMGVDDRNFTHSAYISPINERLPKNIAYTSPRLSHEEQVQSRPYHGTQHG